MIKINNDSIVKQDAVWVVSCGDLALKVSYDENYGISLLSFKNRLIEREVEYINEPISLLPISMENETYKTLNEKAEKVVEGGKEVSIVNDKDILLCVPLVSTALHRLGENSKTDTVRKEHIVYIGCTTEQK